MIRPRLGRDEYSNCLVGGALHQQWDKVANSSPVKVPVGRLHDLLDTLRSQTGMTRFEPLDYQPDLTQLIVVVQRNASPPPATGRLDVHGSAVRVHECPASRLLVKLLGIGAAATAEKVWFHEVQSWQVG